MPVSVEQASSQATAVFKASLFKGETCADLTGGLTIEHANYVLSDEGEHKAAPPFRHEYRLEVEIKVGDEPQRPEQIARMRSVRARGGCYVLARSVEDAVTQIKAFIEGIDR